MSKYAWVSTLYAAGHVACSYCSASDVDAASGADITAVAAAAAPKKVGSGSKDTATAAAAAAAAAPDAHSLDDMDSASDSDGDDGSSGSESDLEILPPTTLQMLEPKTVKLSQRVFGAAASTQHEVRMCVVCLFVNLKFRCGSRVQLQRQVDLHRRGVLG